MTIDAKGENGNLVLKVGGTLDTVTAPELEKEFSEEKLVDITVITMDFTELEYITSAGLRALLAGFKIVDKKGGKMVVKGAGNEVREVFVVTGFDEKIALE